MKHAAAMKYGGELVAAADCTYDSFKELVPLCPECKEPVFLRVGGDRTSSIGKAYQIGPHWCHFKGISAEQVASCESRVNGYTEKDKQRIASKARGQRLKLLQRWFWTLTQQNYSKLEVFSQCSLGTYLADADLYVNEPYSYGMRQYLNGLMQTTPVDQIWEEAFNSRVGSLELIYQDTDKGDKENQEPRGLNKAIAIEVLSFLTCGLSSDLFELLYWAIYAALCDYARMSQYENEDYFKDDAHHALILWLFKVDWASEFQRLEAESQQCKGAA